LKKEGTLHSSKLGNFDICYKFMNKFEFGFLSSLAGNVTNMDLIFDLYKDHSGSLLDSVVELTYIDLHKDHSGNLRDTVAHIISD
jgi:hypothetical protein